MGYKRMFTSSYRLSQISLLACFLVRQGTPSTSNDFDDVKSDATRSLLPLCDIDEYDVDESDNVRIKHVHLASGRNPSTSMIVSFASISSKEYPGRSPTILKY